MDTKRFAVGTVVGGIVLAVVGYLIFDLAFKNFYAANAGSATGVDRPSQIVWAMAIANAAYAALVTYAIERGSDDVTVSAGARIGAIVGCLVWATTDFVYFGSTNIHNLTVTIVDPLLEIVHGGIGGAAIVVALRALAPAPRAVGAT
jgi:uncharacterized membrane protein